MNPQCNLIHELENLSSDFWRENTYNLCCMHDTEMFKGAIYSYPIRKDNDTWYVKGIFCSLECTKKYIIQNCFLNSSTFTLFSLMCKSVYNITTEVYPAPPQEMLKKFFPWKGGLTLEEFRLYGKNKTVLNIVQPPLFPFIFEAQYISSETAQNNELKKSQQKFEVIKEYINTQSNDTESYVERFPSRNLTTLSTYFPITQTGKNQKDHLDDEESDTEYERSELYSQE